MPEYHEKEIKLEVESFEDIKLELKKAGAKFLGETFQRTYRFDTEKRELHKKGLYLRLRSGFEDVLTLKIKVDNPEVFERKELEVKVDDIDKMRSIIRELGFTDERIMEKHRSLWKLGDVEICLDDLPFGCFVELEGDEKSIFKVTDKLGLDTKNKITVTYWDLFEQREGDGQGNILFGSKSGKK